jgi:uncharacterized membrane protein YdbT with pleckstrin-like domain
MEYVSRSLNPDEEVIRIGHFHWLYTFSAIMWVVIGVIGLCAVLYAGYYWEVSRALASQFQGLPASLKGQAWSEIVAQKGGFFSVIKGLHIGIKCLAIASLVFGLFFFAQMMVVRAYTEICITTERLILKQGVLSVNSDELNVDRIEGVNVTQGIIGRWLNYGNVIVRGMGIGEVRLPPMVDPVGFRRAIDQAKAVDNKN